MIKKRIILTAGTFDLLHAGHINIFQKAKQFGKYLIVAVSTDKLVKEHKGYAPILNLKQRVDMIKSIKYVDEVVIQRKLIDMKQFQYLKADLFIIGDDYINRTDIAGLNWLKKNHKVKFIPYTKSLSTTKIKNKIIQMYGRR